MTELVAIEDSSPESQRAAVRAQALAELPGFLTFTSETLQAEASKPADLIAYLNLLTKIAGVDQEKPDKYAGLPTVNITIGSNMTVTTTTVAAPDDVVDVEAKSANPVLELEAAPSEPAPVPKHLEDLNDIFSLLNDFTLASDE